MHGINLKLIRRLKFQAVSVSLTVTGQADFLS
jgi:hypothetical protein